MESIKFDFTWSNDVKVNVGGLCLFKRLMSYNNKSSGFPHIVVSLIQTHDHRCNGSSNYTRVRHSHTETPQMMLEIAIFELIDTVGTVNEYNLAAIIKC